MLEFTVPKMTCGACEKRVRKALEAVEGVEGVSVDLSRHKVGISGPVASAGAAAALAQAGYPPLEA
ncbi:heavy-metal-associated domain-containing protein [Lacibacterium aquatile]|uniref:Heavy-metal-associated domain-containing protein n=1 Tax=Lacibacterium aquatile TaxID=1168082 RepID=A0ABW5DLF3_9PROT